MASSSTDVIRYELYRKGNIDQWMKLITIPATADSIYHYSDNYIQNNQPQLYTVIAVDESLLESPPASAVVGTKLKQQIKPAVAIAEPLVDRASGKLTLKWTSEGSGIHSYKIYRAANDEPLQLYKTVSTPEFTDQLLQPGSRYTYQVMILFADGSKSAFSKSVKLTF
jgi:hypothetical protein